MKIMVALLLAVSLGACGSKSKPSTTPDNTTTDPNTTGTTEPTDGTGGSSYGGEMPPAPEGAEPAATE